jgi:hypothetical protein
MAEWEINKSVGQCFGTGRKMQDGEEYFATLVESEQGLARRDFCVDYWDQQKPQVYCYWKTRVPSTDRKKQIFIDDDMLMAFFERLGAETEPQKVNFRFVLTLILMRKRRLKYDSSRNEADKEVWRLRVVGGDNEFVDVVNPHLDDSQIEQLSSQVGEILQVNFQDMDQPRG